MMKMTRIKVKQLSNIKSIKNNFKAIKILNCIEYKYSTFITEERLEEFI